MTTELRQKQLFKDLVYLEGTLDFYGSGTTESKELLRKIRCISESLAEKTKKKIIYDDNQLDEIYQIIKYAKNFMAIQNCLDKYNKSYDDFIKYVGPMMDKYLETP